MRFFYSILFSFFISFSVSQIPCGAPMMASFCDQACINCDLNGISLTATRGAVGEMPQGYCTFIAHQMQWLGFIAGSQSLSINIDVTACSFGSSLEAGIYSGCDPQNLVSNCETAMFVGGWVLTTTADLEIGCPYFIVFDGNGPADCDFDITVLSGSTSAPSVNISSIIGAEEVCVGETKKYTITADGACSKNWTVIGGIIEGDDDQLEVDITWTTPGIGKVCFTGSNACDPGGMECKDVLVHPEVLDTELGPFKICEGDFYFHDGMEYDEGIYELMYKTPYDCDSLVILIVEEVPTFYEDREIVICEGECYSIATQILCDAGSYEIIIQSIDAPFCDSIFNIELDIYRVEPVISQFGSLGCGDTTIVLRTQDSSKFEGQGFLEYIWRNENDDVVGIDDSLIVTKEGKYCVKVLMSSSQGKICQNDTCFVVTGMDITPELIIPSNPTICLGDSLDLRTLGIYESNGIAGVYSYHTAVPPTDQNKIDPPIIFSSVDTSLLVYFVSGSCTDQLIIDITVQPKPEISVEDTLHICLGDTLFFNEIEIKLLNGIAGLDSFYSDIDFSIASYLDKYIFTDSSQTIYLKSELSPCFDVEEIFLLVHKLPIAEIGILPDSICMDDFIRFNLVNFDQLQPNFILGGGQLSDLGSGTYELRWNSPGWKKINITVEDNFCSSAELCKDIFIQNPLTPLDLDCMTNDSTITFSWSNSNTNGNYTIEVLSGQTIKSQTNQSITIGSLNTRERVEVVITVSTEGPCPDISDTVDCIAIFCPDVEVDLPIVPLICLDNNTTNLDLSPNVFGSNGSGTLKWFGKGIIDSLSPIFDPKIAGEGTHIISVILEEEECFFDDEISIIVVRMPEISFRGSDTICLDSFANLYLDTMWTNDAVANWDFEDANPTPGSGIADQELRWTTTGMKTVSVILTKKGCETQIVSKSFWVDPPLDDLNIRCNSTFTTISLDWDNVQNAGNYIITNDGNYPIKNVTNTSIIVENLNPGTTVTFVVTAESNNSCSDKVKEITCSTIECPILKIELRDTAICFSAAKTMNIPIIIEGNTSVGMGNWLGLGITNTTNGEFDPTISGPGKHKIIYTFTNDVCVYSDSMTIEIFDNPVADAGIDAEINCLNNSIQLGGTATSQGSNISYSWEGNVSDKTIKTPIITEAGTYILTVKDEQSGCISMDEIIITKNIDPPVLKELEVISIGCDSSIDKGIINFVDLQGDGPFEISINNNPFISLQSSIDDLDQGVYSIIIRDRKGCSIDTVVNITNEAKIKLDLGPDIEIDEGESVIITATTNINYNEISWSAPQNLPCQDCTVQSFSPTESMIVTCTVTDKFGCRSTDEVIIRVKIKRVFIPNTFTPNGDGINDEIVIFGSDEVEIIQLMNIYNRWGELVFHATNIVPGNRSLGWKGDFKGNNLNPDVFILHAIIQYRDGEELVLTKDITLIR